MNASRLQPANPDILEGVNDLIKLSYLNEPSVLHNLEFRYAQDKIYVSANRILLSSGALSNDHLALTLHLLHFGVTNCDLFLSIDSECFCTD